MISKEQEYTIQQLRTGLVHYYAQLGVKFITGHFFFSNSFVNFKPKQYQIVTTVRDPIDRWFSEYFYNRYKTVDHARIDDSLENYIVSSEGIAKGNVLVKYIGGARADGDYRSQAAIDSAIASLNHFDVVGVLEKFNRFTIECQEQLGLRLLLPHKRRNPAYKSEQISQKMKSYKGSREIQTELKKICQPDLAVYHQVLSKQA